MRAFCWLIFVLKLSHGLVLPISSSPPSFVRTFEPASEASPDGHFVTGRKTKERAQISTIISTTLVLQQPNIEKARELLLNISDPQSANFGQFLSAATVSGMFRPSAHMEMAIRNWLLTAFIGPDDIKLRERSAVMSFIASVGQLEVLLQAECHVSTHQHTQVLELECPNKTVPDHGIDDMYFTVLNTGHNNHTKWTMDSRTRQSKRGSTNYVPHYTGSLCSPECIRKIYGIPAERPAFHPNNTLGLFEALDQAHDLEDLDLFWRVHEPGIPLGTYPRVSRINHGRAPVATSKGGEESLMDLEIVYPIVYPQEVHVFQVGASDVDPFGTFLDWMDDAFCRGRATKSSNSSKSLPSSMGLQRDGGDPSLCDDYRGPNVLSVSYGSDEARVPQGLMERGCDEWTKLGLQGVSVIVASGDNGVGGHQGCLPDPSDVSKLTFKSLFPASCPFVTSVGSTEIVKPPNDESFEVATRSFASGGGFSNFTDRPEYQKSAVERYLVANKPAYPAGTYNPHGRGYPDVSALGSGIATVVNRVHRSAGGTSASTPIFAGMISRINAERLHMGKNAIGFLNHILYQHPEVFHDITEGRNPACGTDGFRAAPG